MRSDIQIASDVFEIRLTFEVNRLCIDALGNSLHGEVHQLEEVSADLGLSNARRGSEPRNYEVSSSQWGSTTPRLDTYV